MNHVMIVIADLLIDIDNFGVASAKTIKAFVERGMEENPSGKNELLLRSMLRRAHPILSSKVFDTKEESAEYVLEKLNANIDIFASLYKLLIPLESLKTYFQYYRLDSKEIDKERVEKAADELLKCKIEQGVEMAGDYALDLLILLLEYEIDTNNVNMKNIMEIRKKIELCKGGE